MKRLSIFAIAILLCPLSSWAQYKDLMQQINDLSNHIYGGSSPFTNLPVVTSSNQQAGVLFTNDNTYNIGAFQGVNEEFFGVSATNDASILWAGPGGLFVALVELPNHDGSSSPANGEFAIESTGDIALIPNNGGGGTDGHIQIGGAGIPGGAFLNAESNYTVFPFVTPSQPLFFVSRMDTNNTTFEWDPGFVADWPKGSNSYVSHFYIFHDTGTFGQYGKLAGVNNTAIVGEDFYAGTNVSTMFTGVELFGRNGTTTNTLRVDTNGITASGALLLATNAGSSGWAAPIAGYGIFIPSNQDLYWVTSQKTNLVALGH